MIFDNHDDRIRYYDLMLFRDNLDDLPDFRLPEGYRFVFYKPGDKESWIEIEKASEEFKTQEEGMDAWNRYYAGKDDEIVNRMVFIETEDGEKVATATAFYDVNSEKRTDCGWLHWVAVRREYQGRGLSKPLIGYTLNQLRNLGYRKAMIHTQTTTWLACRIYLDFGFGPTPLNAEENRDGWRIVKTLTDHPALRNYEMIPFEEIIRKASN